MSPNARKQRLLVFFSLLSSSLAKDDCSNSTVKPFALSLSNCTISRSEKQDVFSWGLSLAVGQASQTQELCFTPSTVTNNTFLIGRDICVGNSLPDNMTFDQCQSRHGSTYDLVAAGNTFRNLSLTEDQLPQDPGWIEFNQAPTIIGTTDINLVSNLVLHNMTVEVVTEGNNFTAAHLGLGNDSLILQSLVDAQLIPSKGWGLNAGSQSVASPRDGSLVLGGYDAASIKGPFYNYSMGNSITVAGRVCPIQIVVERLHLLLQGQDPIEMVSEGDEHDACIEPYDNLFRLSTTALDKFKSVTGWSNNTTYDPHQVYVLEPGLAYPSQTGFNGSLRFFLSNGLSVTIPNSELTHPLRGLNPSGEKVLQTNITEVNIYGRALGAWVLPKAFLSQMYLAVDYEQQRFQLAEVFQQQVTPNLVPFASNITHCGHSGSKLSTSTIAAIVVAVVVPLLIVAVFVYWVLQKRSSNRRVPYELDGDQSTASPETARTQSRDLDNISNSPSTTLQNSLSGSSQTPTPTPRPVRDRPFRSIMARLSGPREMDSMGSPSMSELEAPTSNRPKLR